MKKLLKSVLVVVMFFLILSPVCFAEDKVDLKAQVKKKMAHYSKK